MHWFTLEWWKYLFAPPEGDIGRIRTAICRARNHPEGIWWYNPNGSAPDTRCKNCNDDLG